MTNEKNPFNTFDDFWWEEDMFSKKDSPQTTEQSKEILDKINEMSDNILKNLRPVDNRTIQEIIDDQFIPIDDRTQQELEDDDYLSLESDNEIANPDVVTLEDDNYLSSESDNEIDTPAVAKPDDILKPTTVTLEKINEISDNILRNIKPVDNRTKQELIDDQFIPLDDRTYQQLQDDDYLNLASDNKIIEIDTTNAWDSKKTSVAKPGEIFKLSTDYNRKLKAANKIKNKYLRKK